MALFYVHLLILTISPGLPGRILKTPCRDGTIPGDFDPAASKNSGEQARIAPVQ